MAEHHRVTFIDLNREAQCPPNPQFPEGININLAGNASEACLIVLPYPSPRVGLWAITCDKCGTSAMVTTAGRVDDPRSIVIECKRKPGP